ncbi:MAG: MFS transporter [Bacteroidota bacterium]
MHRSPCDEGVIESGPHGGAADACEEDAKPWVLAATIGGSSLAFIVGSVVNVALPAMQRGLGATVAEVQWVLNAYLLFLGALILVGGSAGDRFGRRRLFVAGTVVFTLASVGCGLAPTTGWLIAARAVQGVGAALLVPNSLAIISAAFEGAERGKAIGTWAGFSALTTALGPVLGGWLVDAFSWRWVFFVVVPVALGTLGIALWKVPESRDRASTGRLDAAGAALAAASFGALTYGLIASAERGWGDSVVLAAVAGAVGLFGLFLLREARAPDPMVPLDLFRSPTFSGANAVTLGLYFALTGVLFFLPFNLIQVQGYSATAAGAAFLPFSLVVGFFSRPAGGLVERFGARLPLVVGPLVTALGLALLVVPSVGGWYWTTFFPPMLVLGTGMAIAVAPLTTVVMDSVDESHAGTASGVNNAASRIAGLLAVAVLGVVALGTFNAALDEQLAAADVSAQTEALLAPFRSDLTGADLPDALQGDERAALQALVGAAFVASFRWVAGISAALALLSALCAALTIRPVAEPEAQP